MGQSRPQDTSHQCPLHTPLFQTLTPTAQPLTCSSSLSASMTPYFRKQSSKPWLEKAPAPIRQGHR